MYKYIIYKEKKPCVARALSATIYKKKNASVASQIMYNVFKVQFIYDNPRCFRKDCISGVAETFNFQNNMHTYQ